VSVYQHKEYSMGFTVQEGPKTYGKVRLKSGREIYRNYGHELKNGKGISFLDRLAAHIEASKERMSKLCGVSSFMLGADRGDRK
jgi:hypothetical protein